MMPLHGSAAHFVAQSVVILKAAHPLKEVLARLRSLGQRPKMPHRHRLPNQFRSPRRPRLKKSRSGTALRITL